ncbi:protein HEADING DATE 3B-like isoform X2 [Macadamia integrifolia]|uniref:protein HEADING DATE 3B-like isoform X2 n=1 Tax=Macadamia integrifolia TaxID=60698 RepID=UPI001C5007FB|nr:protein HEADING DATE 3B-like isoform X2 [Macadamia integrifolia]
MMEGGKDEEKIMSPLFPRLHVNDKEKGGPRAPPRNKMALYEQLSIPSQRFNSRLPSHNAGSLVPSTSSTQGGGHERSVPSPLQIPSATPVHFAEKLHSCSSDGVNLNVSMAVFERKSMKNANYQTSNATGFMPSTPECNSFHPYDYSNSRNSGQKQLGDEDDVRVPTFVPPGVAPCPNMDIPSMDGERLAPFCPTDLGHSTVNPVNNLLKSAATSSYLLIPPQNVCNEHSKRSDTTDMRSRQPVRNHIEDNLKGSFTNSECTEMPASHKWTREKVADALKDACGSANPEHQNSQLGDFGRVNDTGGWVQQKSRAGLLQNNTVCGDGISVEFVGLEKGNISRVRSGPCSRVSPGNCRRRPDHAEFGSECHEDNSNRSLQVREVDRNDDVSETSMLDSISGLDISPDDVVGVIGQKRFWKARREIVNQQRLFAVQVFELHRLIKVSPMKKLPAEYVLKPLQQNVKQKDDSQKPNQSIECAAENAVAKPTLPAPNNGMNPLVSQHSSCGLYPGNPPAAPVVTDNKMGPWCFHPPPGNQWLVPILSPSEGLLYKPYTGPCPPTAGYMAPIYGGCGPFSLPPVAGDFMNPAYGVMATHQHGIGVLPGAPPVGPPYFTPYGIPVMSPVTSASAVDQASLLAGPRPHGLAEQLSTGEAKFNMHQESSCNYSNQKSEAVANGVWRFKTSKDSELQGSTGSSPCQRTQGGPDHVAEGSDPLPLFAMASAVQVPDGNPQDHGSDQQTRVIRVVPHNPRSATESAARIFRSIQKERQQYTTV